LLRSFHSSNGCPSDAMKSTRFGGSEDFHH
jgi:hypothetical protein